MGTELRASPNADEGHRRTLSHRCLLVILYLNAALLMSAFFAVLLPYRWMDAVHRWIGLGSLPDTPLMGYLTRSISFLYGMLGVLTFILAVEARRYWPLIRWWGWSCIGSGVVFGIIDVAEKMPVFWTLSEAPYLIVVGILALYLHANASRASNESAAK